MELSILDYQREQRIRTILEAIPDDLMIVDREGHIREYKAGRSVSHLPMDQFLGTHLGELLSPEMVEKVKEGVHKTLLEKTASLVQISLGSLEFEARIVSLEDEVALILFRDVTAQREAERIKAEFIASVSHELRTPLASILGFTELLINQMYAPDEHGEFLENIQHSTLRLKDMVNNLLDASRLDAGSFSVHPIAASLRDILLRTGRSFAGVAKLAGVEFVWELESLPTVCFDPERIAQVTGNLLSNALKFCPRGGTIWVRARPQEDGVLLEIQDTGPGIPLAEQNRLFQRYARSSNAIQRGIAGTGLGLYISKAIVEAHSGYIWLESDTGLGAKISVWLPTNP